MQLRAGDLRWQTGASRWSRIRTLVITDDAEQRQRLATRRDTVVVGSPLELVFALEDTHRTITTIVLAGRFVLDHGLVSFLGESYPDIGVDRVGAETN